MKSLEIVLRERFSYLILFSYILFAIIGMILLMPVFENAFADSDFKHIAIEFSETCESLQLLNDSNTCYTPQYVKAMFPPPQLKPNYQTMFDNAKQTDSFQYQKNDILLNHKLSCIQKDYCNVFNNPVPQFYWYNPDNKAREYYDVIITIQTNLKHTNLNTSTNDIQFSGNDRRLELNTNQISIRSCQKVIYDPINMLSEMGGLLWYLLDDCKDPTKLGVLNHPYTKPLNVTSYSPDDSPEYKILKQREALKEKYKEYRIGKD